MKHHLGELLFRAQSLGVSVRFLALACRPQLRLHPAAVRFIERGSMCGTWLPNASQDRRPNKGGYVWTLCSRRVARRFARLPVIYSATTSVGCRSKTARFDYFRTSPFPHPTFLTPMDAMLDGPLIPGTSPTKEISLSQTGWRLAVPLARA